MNCIIVDDDDQIRFLMETLVKESEALHLVKSCSTALEASNILLKEKIDLIFLDVMMPGMSGMEFLKTLEGEKPQVIMITANKEFAAEAFDFEVCDFIVKPITHSRFLRAVSKAKKLTGAKDIERAKDTFFVKFNSILVKINMEDIFLIEALADYIAVHTLKQKYIVHSTMKDVLNKLPKNDYIRVHNSYIVRVDKISSIEGNNLYIGKQTVPISRAKQKDLMNRIELLN
ncbi:MAG: LytTR family DNA-binding domain-containing protein [Bacteroidota bacterium]